MTARNIISLSLVFSFIYSVTAQNGEQVEKVQPENIENIKIQKWEIGNSFLLFQEDLFKPNKQANGQIIQVWKRDTSVNDLKMIEEETMDLGKSIGASCTQKWYRNEKKEKIEVDIIICLSENEIDKVVEIFTKKMYSTQFMQTEIPLAGDISWIANNLDNYTDTYSIMFLRANVFVRIYVNLKYQNINDLNITIKNLTDIIETKINSFL